MSPVSHLCRNPDLRRSLRAVDTLGLVDEQLPCGAAPVWPDRARDTEGWIGVAGRRRRRSTELFIRGPVGIGKEQTSLH